LEFRNIVIKRPEYYLVFILLWSNLTAGAYPIRFDQYTTEDGLSSNQVYSIHQDRYGFMWFGTFNGLNRFDGYSFKNYYQDPQDSLSLSHNKVRAICEDDDGNLWFGTEGGGLDRFNQIDQKFHNYSWHPDQIGSLSNNHVMALLFDSRGNLWAGTKNGLNCLKKDSLSFTNYQKETTAGLPDDNITCITEFPSGILWIGTGSGFLIRLEIDSERFSTIRPDRLHPNRQNNNYISGISYNSSDSTIWFGVFTQGVIEYVPDKDSLTVHRINTIDADMASVNYPFSIITDTSGTVWVGSVLGLTKIEPESETYTYFRTEQNNPYSISDNVIDCLYIDNQQTLWIGTGGKGINKYDPDLVRFQQYRHDVTDSTSIPNNRVYDITEDLSGNIWIGTCGGGLSRKSKNGTGFTHYQSDDSDPGVWSSNYIMKIICSQNNLIWLATWESGLFSFDPVHEEYQHFRNFPDDSTSLSDNKVVSVYEDRSGYIWAGTMEQGLNRLNRKTGEFTRFSHDPTDPTSISNNTIFAITEDSSGQLWIGTFGGGLNRFDRDSNTFTSFQAGLGKPNSISSNNITSITIDSRNRFWIGTSGGGLNRFDPVSGLFSSIGKFEGLPGNVVNGILEDDEGYLWLSTLNSITRFHPDSFTFTHYSAEDGLQNGEFYYSSCFKSTSGSMYFGGDNGLNVFQPAEVKNNPYLPPIVLTDIQINYKPLPAYKWQAPHLIQELPLTYKDRVVTFEYSALDYSVPRKNQYSCQMEGFDRDWVLMETSRKITYTNLDPGSYTLRIRGSNNDGIWNMAGLQLPIVIAPPFWQTIWFRFLVLLTIVGVIAIVIQVRMNRLRQIERDLAAERELKLKLDHHQRELVTKSMDLIEKQDILEDILSQLNSIEKTPNDKRSELTRPLIRRLKNLVSFNHVWEEFEKWFSEIHTGFIRKLRADYPKLTLLEIKVCALLRLNLTSKEIASLMNVEPSSVNIYRYRIRKKLGLSNHDDLLVYLNKY